MRNGSAILRKFSGYFLTGGTAAVVDAGGFALLHGFGVSVPVAAVLSFLVAAVVNYLLTTKFVFGQAATSRQFALFIAMAAVGLVINAGLTVAAASLLAVPAPLAKVLAIGLTFCVNFCLNYFVVFKTSSTE